MASEYLKWKYKDVQPDEPLVLTQKQKRQNWWHYHKWHVIIGAVLLVTAGSIVAHALGLGQTKPDYRIAYVGASPLPADTVAAIEAKLTNFGEDLNGDGKVVFKINQYPTDSNEEGADAAQYAAASYVRLMGDLESRESCLFILEDYETFHKNYDVLADATGAIAENPDTADVLKWSDRPDLSGLGAYTVEVLGETVTGDSDKLIQDMYLARRGYLPDDNDSAQTACTALWAQLTKGANR